LSRSSAIERKKEFSAAVPPPCSPDIIQRDNGLFQLGLHDDAAGPFTTRNDAIAVATEEVLNAGTYSAEPIDTDGKTRHLQKALSRRDYLNPNPTN
jgi:hypothetical protein